MKSALTSWPTDTPALTPQEKDEAAFQAYANDSKLNVLYKELPESDEEAVRKLRNIWEIIKNEKNRTCCNGMSLKSLFCGDFYMSWEIKEPTKAKHKVLKSYLGAWFPIMSFSNPKIVYIDGFV